MDNNYDNLKKDIFMCNSQECFNLNQYQTSYSSDKTIKPQNIKNTKCILCSYDFDNLENLRKQIYEETLRNNMVKNNLFKAKILEFIITFGLCVVVFCAVFYFIMQIYLFSK